MEAYKSQRHHSQYCQTTTRVPARRVGVVILLNTQAAELT